MTTEKRKRRTYSEEFKREAVELVRSQGYSRAEAGRSLDIPPNMIGRWLKEQDQTASGERLTADEREELKKLRRENRELRMEKEILKKASVDSTGHCNTYYPYSVYYSEISHETNLFPR